MTVKMISYKKENSILEGLIFLGFPGFW